MCNMEQETKTTPAVEVWRPVRDFEGLYEVSNIARVRSLDVCEERISKQGKFYIYAKKGKVLTPKVRDGYLYQTLCKDKVKKNKSIHRLVAEAFIPNPDNLPCINHKDENKQNNLPSNLEWCSVLYNNKYGTRPGNVSKAQSRKVEQLTLDGKHVAYFDSARQAAKQLGISESNICGVIKGRCKTAHGYRWARIVL